MRSRLERIRTTLVDFSAERGHAEFVFTPSDQNGMGIVAVTASALGQSGAASSAVIQSSDLEEAAYQVGFTLEGRPAYGWLWFAPFKNGDVVDVVVEWQEDHYEVMAIARPSDRTVALYPHLSRGRRAHWKVSWRWGGAFIFLFLLLVNIPMFIMSDVPKFSLSTEFWSSVIWGATIIVGFFSLMVYSLAIQRMKFVGVAERAFRALGWEDVSNIDLVKRSKPRLPDDPPELGTFYFRY